MSRRHASYEIFEEIGRGEGTTVYRAHDLTLGRDVAIKELSDEEPPDPRRRDRFLKEAQFLAQFEHAGILRIYSVETEPGWIVMELMKGTLAAQIHHKPLPAEAVRSILRQLLPALEFLHGRNRIHGAVRPSNILIDELGTVKLSDFEESNSLGELRAPTGTKKYLAPELIRAEFGSLGPATDLYGLGFTALELLAGPSFDSKFPHLATAAIDPDVAWLRWHSSEEPFPPTQTLIPSVPEDLAEAIDSMLKKHVNQRCDSASAAAKILTEQAVVPVFAIPAAETVHSAADQQQSMLPAAVREIEPLPASAKSAPPPQLPREQAIHFGSSAQVGSNSASRTPREKLNEAISKPFVLYPLCAAMLVGALATGMALRQSRRAVTRNPVAVGSESELKPRSDVLQDATEEESSSATRVIEQAGQSIQNEAGTPEPDTSEPVEPERLLAQPTDNAQHPTEDAAPEPSPDPKLAATPQTVESAEAEEIDDVSEPVTPLKSPTDNALADNQAISEEEAQVVVEPEPEDRAEPPLPEVAAPAPQLEFVSTKVDPSELIAEFKGQAELVIDAGGFMSEVTDIAISPDGRWLAATGAKEVRIWELASGKLVETLRGDRARTSYGDCYAVEFSPDNQFLVVGVNDYQPHGSIRVYRTDALDEIDALLPGHTAPVRKLDFSRDGKWMASVDADGHVAIWNWEQRTLVRSIPPRNVQHPIFDELHFPGDEPVLSGIDYEGPVLFSTPDLKRLGGRDVLPPHLHAWVLDVLSRKLEYPFHSTEDPRNVDLRLERGLWAAAGVGQGEGSNKFWVAVWPAHTLDEPAISTPSTVYAGHKWSVTTVDLAPEHRLVASGDKFGEIHVWDLGTAERVHRFAGQGKPIYEAAFDRNTRRIAFGTQPFAPDKWARNNYGPVDQVLDLEKRAIYSAGDVDDLQLVQERSFSNDVQLQVTSDSGQANMAIEKSIGGRVVSRYDFTTGRNPTIFSVLDQPELSVQTPVLLGDNLGLLALWDSDTDELKRAFVGHDGMVSSVSRSTQGKMVLSGSVDRTLRIWSLENPKPTGIFDFKFENSVVTRVKPGSSSAKAGVQEGDRIVSIDDKSMAEMYRMMLDGTFDYRPGQSVRVQMRRGEEPYAFAMQLAEGYDFVDPILSVYIGDDGQWIVWTPQGYYDASPGAEGLIGWHINRGPSKSANFYRVQQFRKQLYRPDIIDRILSGQGVEEAVKSANQVRGNREEVDFRSPSDLALRHPPEINFISPQRGDQLTSSDVRVQATIKSRNGLPIREVTLLVNGVADRVFVPQAHSAQLMEIDHTVALQPGRNDIEFIAANAESTSGARAIYVTANVPAATRLPRLHALAIGISDYASSESRFQDLPSAASDARAFASMVQRQADGKLYSAAESRILTDSKASRTEILDGLQWLVDQTEDGDSAAIFVAAHGFIDSSENFYVGTHEVDIERPRATALSWREFTQTLHEDLPRCRRLVFLDIHPTQQAIAPGIRNPLLDLAAPELATIFFSSNSLQQSNLTLSTDSRGYSAEALLRTVADTSADTQPTPPDSLLSAEEISHAWTEAIRELSGGKLYPVAFAPESSKRTNVLQIQTHSK